ncbi:MAG: HEAT repeat domain-containing protein [Planctomycetota bacterium]
MSYPTDLLPYGEQFAELGLVVRQLDDGSLTVAQDDTLPDQARAHIRATPPGLQARLALFPSGQPADLLGDALESLNSASARVKYAWADGVVWCESTMPWTGDRSFPLSSLRALYEGVNEGSAQQRENLARLAGVELPPAAPPAAPSPGSAPRSEIGSQAVGGPVGPALPPSFLPGAGQTSGEGATQRYGAVRDVPGRAEFGAHDADATHSRPSGRYARSPAPSGGGGGGAMAAIVGVLVLVLLGLGFAIKNKLEDEPAPGPSVATAPTPAVSASPSPEETPERDPWASPSPSPSRVERPTPSPSAAKEPRDEEGSIYAQAASAREGDRVLAVKRWRDEGYETKPKARLRLLKALSGRIDREIGLILTKSFRDHPVGVYEALDCLEHANSSIKRVIFDQLSRRELSKEERSVVAEMLAEQGDDAAIDEALLRLGKPRKGSFQRLLDARGVEWLQLGDGRALLSKLPLADLAALLGHDKPEVRVLVLDLLGDRSSEVERALEAIAKGLQDKDVTVRRRAVEAVGSLKHGRGAWYLAQALAREEDKRSHELIRSALGRLPVKAATGYLKSMLAKNQRPETRLAGVTALRAIPNVETVGLIVEAVGDEDRKVRVEALEGLVGLLGNSELLPAIRKGVLTYRKQAVDKADPESRRLAQRLCLKIDGRIPR